MSFFRELMRDRKLQLALLTAVLAVLLGFWAIPTQTGLQLVIYGGYWMMLLTTALFV